MPATAALAALNNLEVVMNTNTIIVDRDGAAFVIPTELDLASLPSYEEARDNRTGSTAGNIRRILAARTGVYAA